MTILLDSALADEAEAAHTLGFVQGITTNPLLMRAATNDPLEHLGVLLGKFPAGDVYYQPCGLYGDPLSEAERAWKMAPDRVTIKILATLDGAKMAAELTRQGASVALTAAQSPAVMAVARSLGAMAVIPYVDRAMRDQRTDRDLVAALARLRRPPVRIIAASIKNVGQLVGALNDGADAVSAPLAVLVDLVSHPATEDAARAFARALEPCP
jgi:transaldolase